MYSTYRQRNLIEDIEKLLGIEYSGSLRRKDADIFIAEHMVEFRQTKLDLNKHFPPTGKQARFIEKIEETLCVKFTGRTVNTAAEFIGKYMGEFKSRETSEMKMKSYIDNKAKGIGIK